MSIKSYLDECSRQYYQGTPIIPDEVFDRLAESIGYTDVGARQHEHIQKHYYQMYSLEKFYEDEKKVNPLANESDIAVSNKLDGAAIDILYVDGKLTRVLTRGDGIEGTDITDKFINSDRIPKTIRHDGIVQITGEVAAPKHIPNARNYAAGALNLKDASEFNTRAVEFFAYGVQPSFSETYTEDMQLLKRIGFNTVQDAGLAEIYPTDGLVFRVNNNKRAAELGYSTNWPNFSYARKERSKGVDTKILDVVWQVGKSGKVTPVAILEPVQIGDAVVSRATLNNIAFIEALDLHIGDTVNVARAGEIIPCVLYKVE